MTGQNYSLSAATEETRGEDKSSGEKDDQCTSYTNSNYLPTSGITTFQSLPDQWLHFRPLDLSLLISDPGPRHGLVDTSQTVQWVKKTRSQKCVHFTPTITTWKSVYIKHLTVHETFTTNNRNTWLHKTLLRLIFQPEFPTPSKSCTPVLLLPVRPYPLSYSFPFLRLPYMVRADVIFRTHSLSDPIPTFPFTRYKTTSIPRWLEKLVHFLTFSTKALWLHHLHTSYVFNLLPILRPSHLFPSTTFEVNSLYYPRTYFRPVIPNLSPSCNPSMSLFSYPTVTSSSSLPNPC